MQPEQEVTVARLGDECGEILRRGGDVLIVQTSSRWFADDWAELRRVEQDILGALYCLPRPALNLTRILPYDLPTGVSPESRDRFDQWLAVASLVTADAPTLRARLLLATRRLDEVPEVTVGRSAVEAVLGRLRDSLIAPEPPLFD